MHHMQRVGPVPEDTRQLRAELHDVTIDPFDLRAYGAERGRQYNPSLLVHDGQLWCVVRVLTSGTQNIGVQPAALPPSMW